MGVSVNLPKVPRAPNEYQPHVLRHSRQSAMSDKEHLNGGDPNRDLFPEYGTGLMNRVPRTARLDGNPSCSDGVWYAEYGSVVVMKSAQPEFGFSAIEHVRFMNDMKCGMKCVRCVVSLHPYGPRLVRRCLQRWRNLSNMKAKAMKIATSHAKKSTKYTLTNARVSRGQYQEEGSSLHDNR